MIKVDTNPFYRPLLSKRSANEVYRMFMVYLEDSLDYSDTEHIQIIFYYIQPDIKINDYEIIHYAAYDNLIDVVRRAMEMDDKAVSAYNNRAFMFAIEAERVDMARLLLSDPTVDPHGGEDRALRYACDFGQKDMVRLLLDDGRIDPSTKDNDPMRNALFSGHTEIIRMLVDDPRFSRDGMRPPSCGNCGSLDCERRSKAWVYFQECLSDKIIYCDR